MPPGWRPPGRRAPRVRALAVETTSKPRARATGIWWGSNVSEGDRPGEPVGGGEVDGVDGAQRVARARARRRGRGSAWSTGTTWMRSQSSRRARRRLVALGRVVGEPVDEHERLGEGQRRRAPVGVGGHGVEDDGRGSGPSTVAGQQRRWCRARASSAVPRHAHAAHLAQRGGRAGRRPTRGTGRRGPGGRGAGARATRPAARRGRRAWRCPPSGLERAELGHGAPVDGDHDALAGAGPPHRRRRSGSAAPGRRAGPRRPSVARGVAPVYTRRVCAGPGRPLEQAPRPRSTPVPPRGNH